MNSKKTVVVSGPDPLLRARARKQLEDEGFDVVEAESDTEAWERYQRGLDFSGKWSWYEPSFDPPD